MTVLQDADDDARRSASRAGYRTGFGDDFEAADTFDDAAQDQPAGTAKAPDASREDEAAARIMRSGQ